MIRQQKHVSEKRHRIRKGFIVSALFGLLVVILSLMYLYFVDGISIPRLYKDANVQFSKINESTFLREGYTTIYDKDNNVINKFAVTDYTYAKIENIPPIVQHSFIATEDRDFFSHKGISIKAMFRAVFVIIKTHGKDVQGGSTLTQQLVKNVFLTQDRTIKRKIEEVILSVKLEHKYTKQQILEYYLNNIYFGNGAYGIESASKKYFSKSCSQLTPAEIATLTAIPNNPTLFNPETHIDNNTARRDLVLKNLLDQKYISEVQYDTSVNAKTTLALSPHVAAKDDYCTSFAVYCAVKNLMTIDGFEFKYKFKDEAERASYYANYKQVYAEFDKKVRSGGYQIYTSFDMAKQSKLQKSVTDGLADFTAKDASSGKYSMQGASVCTDNSTGMVVSIVGGRDPDDAYNRAFLSYRQPGSAIKPLLVYAPAFEKGYAPSSYETDGYIKNGPKNAENSYFGTVNLRYAIAASLNTIPFKLMDRLGPEDCMNYLQNMDFSHIHTQDYNAITAIGGFTEGVSPVEMAGGYTTLERQGLFSESSCVKSIRYKGIQDVYTYKPANKKVYSDSVCYMITDMLKGVFNESYGTGHAIKPTNFVGAGKTGTTSDSKDGWMCGYSQYYTTVVWVGYDTPTSVGNLYGATYPGNIWKNFMTDIHTNVDQKDFTRPDTVITKYVDSKGGATDVNTGVQDIFSKPLLAEKERLAEERRQKEAKAKAEQEEKDRQEQLAKDPERQSKCDSELKTFEEFHYLEYSDISKGDTMVDNIKQSIQTVMDKDMAEGFTKRLNTRVSIISQERDSIARKEQQRKQQAEQAQQNDAENQVIQTFNEFMKLRDKTTVYQQDIDSFRNILFGQVGKLTDTTKKTKYMNEIDTISSSIKVTPN